MTYYLITNELTSEEKQYVFFDDLFAAVNEEFALLSGSTNTVSKFSAEEKEALRKNVGKMSIITPEIKLIVSEVENDGQILLL